MQCPNREKGNPIYSIGISGSLLEGNLVRDSVESGFRDKELKCKILMFHGLNALCAALNAKGGEIVFSWGISAFELRSRACAHLANISLNRGAILLTLEVEDREVQKLAKLGGLEHLYLWMREHHFPAPYSASELGHNMYDVIRWVAHSLYMPRLIGGFPALHSGTQPTESQKTLLVQMFSSFLRVLYAPATMDNFDGAY